MENVFEPILDKDEKIVKIFKPKKSIFYAKNLIPFAFLLAFMEIFTLIMGAGISFWDEDPLGATVFWGIVIGSIIVIAIILGLTILFMSIYYRNVHYVYTNKRIVIRKGIIGVDYKSLDIDMIGASTVNVSLLDKILRKNTGTISFGSMASPMVATSGSMTNFILAHIDNPYDVYKEIKNFISENSRKLTSKKTEKNR